MGGFGEVQTVQLFYGMRMAGCLLAARRGSKGFNLRIENESDAEPDAAIKRTNRRHKKQNLPRREALFVFQFNANADALR
jgi:hypothetical protein